MSGLPHWTAARVLDPAGEAGAQPGYIRVSRAERGGKGLLWSDQPCEDVGQRQGDRVVALHHHEPLPGHHDHLQLPLTLPGHTDLWRGRKY